MAANDDSLDGYIEDQTGAFDWVNSDQVFDFITELLRPLGTHLLGRRLYETMAYWDAPVEGYPPRAPRIRTGLAEGREDRLFTNADRRYEAHRARRTGLRLRGDSEAQGELEHDIFLGGPELARLALESDLAETNAIAFISRQQFALEMGQKAKVC